jgi:hypothetical protein
MRRGGTLGALALLLGGCRGDGAGADTTAEVTGESGSGESDGDGDGDGDASDSEGDGDGGIRFDTKPTLDSGDTGPICKVTDDMDAVGTCEQKSPPDAFTPDIQWIWDQVGSPQTIITPLVANLTDDDENGEIDLCDIPDVVVVAGGGLDGGRITVLDGETGTEHFEIAMDVAQSVSPALGDIDADGLPEIVAATPGGLFHSSQPSRLVAFEHDGTFKWMGTSQINHGQGFAIALADIDHDGDVEVIADDVVADHLGQEVFVAPEQAGWTAYDVWHCTATAAADLDGDDEQEIILGQSAYRVDGSQYYLDASIEPGFPQIADLDDDGLPEILVTNRQGITILEHDGTVKVKDQKPTGDAYPAWFRPATVHDFDGDDESEMAVSSASHYSVVEPMGLALVWSANVQDASGWSSGTAFDFLGDGSAEAMYTDEVALFVFDDMGNTLLNVPRSSPTLIEYPIVADIDNDGSAEIVVPSFGQNAPALQVIRDVDDRWIQARRIWNQHTYHVTNVREDGTIPQFEPRSWEALNTYRTNAQIEGGGICKPEG